jgi:hypothetical protein
MATVNIPDCFMMVLNQGIGILYLGFFNDAATVRIFRKSQSESLACHSLVAWLQDGWVAQERNCNDGSRGARNRHLQDGRR